MPDRRGTIVQGLVAVAALVVIIAGLKAASDIVLPVLFSAFLAVLAVPLVRWLTSRGLPAWVAIPVVVLLFTAGLVGITAVAASAVRGFTENFDRYDESATALLVRTTALSRQFGVELDVKDIRALVQPSVMLSLLTQSLNAVVAVLSQVLIVIITMTFILFEATELELKFQAAFGTKRRATGPFTDATAQVQRYLAIKSLASAATGVLVWVACAAVGLDFALLWGVLAFLLNYVPAIGSIVAAVPATLLALLQLGPGWAIGLALWYLAVNTTIGNFLEPRFLGRQLGLSPLVVLLSLLFWGWVWGPAGMLFCIPMTVIAKLFLESRADTRWIAVFLGSPKEILDHAEDDL